MKIDRENTILAGHADAARERPIGERPGADGGHQKNRGHNASLP